VSVLIFLFCCQGPPFTGVRIAGVPGSGPTAAGGPAPNRREFPVQQQPQQQLYAHEPGVKIPERMCLLGCVFFILDYQRTIPATELSYWTKMMLNKGAEVESTYSMRVTHVLCETTRTPLAQQAMRDGKRLVTAFWFNDVILKQQMFLPTQVSSTYHLKIEHNNNFELLLDFSGIFKIF